jgi:putative methyltransferase (TIGR04325 family)
MSMSATQALKEFCPPALWRLLRATRDSMAPPPPRMFSGVYERFDQVEDQHPWSQPAYLEMSRAQLREAPAVHSTARATHAVLTTLLNGAPAGRAPRVLDWGGGTGLRFWTTRPALVRPVDWLVVDNPVLARLNDDVNGRPAELSFVSELPSDGAFDLILIVSALQYVDQPLDVLRSLTRFRPRHLVLSRLMAHPDRTYVTRQSLYGSSTPCRVSSLAGVTQTLEEHGYQRDLLMDDGFDLSAMCDSSVPADLRPGHERLLVFREA